MRYRILSALAVFAVATSHAETPKQLDVHEWGTFTVLMGSEGTAIRWYQPANQLVELPSFVQRPGLGSYLGEDGKVHQIMLKGGAPYQGMDYVRMETPVLYFYPSEPMPVEVKVNFDQGRITEVYPASIGLGNPVIWKGDLLRPDDSAAALGMPMLKKEQGRHYGHARSVPDAWFFHTKQRLQIQKRTPEPGDGAGAESGKASAPEYKDVDQYEKFIFYRGAGGALPPFNVAVSEDERDITMLRQQGQAEQTVAFALNVDGNKARWVQLSGIKTEVRDKSEPFQWANPKDLSVGKLGENFQPLEKTCDELAAALINALASEGLSQDEAKAMVATWRDAWLKEPGTRVLAIMPNKWVDSVLPLDIKPAPQKLTRVFVGRFELITPSREAAMVSLLNGGESGAPQPEKLAQYKALQLGRFSSGVMQRAQTIQAQRMESRFAELELAAGRP